MASPDLESSWLSSPASCIRVEEANAVDEFHLLHCIPKPPPFPARKGFNDSHRSRKVILNGCCYVPKEVKYSWDSLFKEAWDADVYIITHDGSFIPAHSNILSAASPVLGNILRLSVVKNGISYIKLLGVPSEAVYVFIRFLYSSCYEDDDMKKFVLHLLLLSHSYCVPSLKRICTNVLEQDWLTHENVIDLLLLARNCDLPRLSFLCVRMVMKDFKRVSSTEGWKVMKRAYPTLEQELLESLVEADSRKQERARKIQEKRVYLQLYEAMEALLHICRDGCRTIGPRDKVLKGSETSCRYHACKGLESLVRHFSSCKLRVPGGCAHCKRMWQLLELHSRMCDEPDYCRVPLCGHFKEKTKRQTKREAAKWNMLVHKVKAARNSLGPFSSQMIIQVCFAVCFNKA